MIYGIKGANDLAADLVIEVGNDTYVCSLDPNKLNRQSETPIESQNCWRIEKYHVETTDGVSRQTTLYPGGLTDFAFAAASYSTYTYGYRL